MNASYEEEVSESFLLAFYLLSTPACDVYGRLKTKKMAEDKESDISICFVDEND